MDEPELWRELGQQLRVDSIRASAKASSGHPTSSMSAADLMAVLLAKHLRYDFDEPEDPRERPPDLLQGPRVAARSTRMFRAAGAITDEELLTYRQFGSRLEGHPTPVMPWVDVATGSLGQGLPIGVGMALAGKHLDRLPYRVWVLCGDSEMAEGSMWEAFEHAAFYELDNLTAIIDVNRLGQRGETMHGWDLDSYVEARRGVRLERDRDRRARRRGRSTARTPRPSATTRPADRDRRAARSRARASRRSRTRTAGTARRSTDPEEAIAELGGDPEHRRRRPEAGATASRTRFEPAPASSCRATSSARRSRRARRTAKRCAALGGERGDVVALDGEVSNSTYAEIFRDAHPDRYFEMYIAEQQMVAAAVGLQVRGWKPVRLDVRGVPLARVRLRPHGGDQPRDTAAVRLARRRLDRRGRPVADGARGSRRVPRGPRQHRPLPVRREPDGEARRRDGRPRRHLVHAHDARRTRRSSTAPTRSSRSAAREIVARRRRRHDRRRRDHAARGAQGGRRARRARGSRPA